MNIGGKSVVIMISVLILLSGAVSSSAQEAAAQIIENKAVNNSAASHIAKKASLDLAPVLKLRLPDSGSADGQKQTGQVKPTPAVALTFDLCMGQTDRRIFDVLVQNNIPTTLFVTRRWLDNPANAPIIETIKSRPDLFEIGNHGAEHIPPIDNRPTIYKLKTAGSAAAICAEAQGGLKAIEQAGLAAQMSGKYWYRGAAALYSPNALRLLHNEGYSIAGFSINGDAGATLSAKGAYAQIVSAKNGDVIIAHMNQPKRMAGAGVAAGILALQKRSYRFIRLSQAEETETAPHLAEAGLSRDIFLRSVSAPAPEGVCPAASSASVRASANRSAQ